MTLMQKIANKFQPDLNLPQIARNPKESKMDTETFLDAVGVPKHPHSISTIYHTGLINKSFFIMRLILIVLGRWPFSLELMSVKDTWERGTHTRKHQIIRRVENYVCGLKSFLWLYFGLTTLFISFVLVMCTLGFFDFFLEWNLLPGFKWANLDKSTFRKNLVLFLLVWGCLLHGTMSSIAMFIDRKKLAAQLNYWNYAVENLGIKKMTSHRRFLIIANIGYVLFLVLIYVAYSFGNVRFVRDGAALFGTLALRPWLSESQFDNVEGMVLRIFGMVVIIYGVYASRAYLFIFSFKCRILRSLFKEWNERLIKFLRKQNVDMKSILIEKGKSYEEMEKMESDKLMKDMVTLLTMVKQMDSMFSVVLTSYYAIQLLNMCFELYMLAKSGTDDFTRSSERSLDIISALITLFQNVYFFFTVSLDGASVGEEAAKGLDAIREYPLRPDWSVHKKYLVYNLGVTYNQKIAITGAKFFVIDRPFIITVLGAVLTYFVIILQVEPSFKKQNDQIG